MSPFNPFVTRPFYTNKKIVKAISLTKIMASPS